MNVTKRKQVKPCHLCLIITVLLFSSFIIFYLFWLDQLIFLLKYLPGSYESADTNRNLHELIESRGFAHDSHFIVNSGGYILQVVRIINPYHKGDRSRLKPVLLFHGFQCSGTLWLVARDGILHKNGRYIEFDENHQPVSSVGNSLGFVLATRGYDVWLSNYRGSVYSKNHSTLSTDDSKFWSFSIDEMISTDLPATIDYIRNVTRRQTISYIGHSQGNFMMFGLLATKPEYSQYIKPFIAISPVFYLSRFLVFDRVSFYLRWLNSYLRYFPGLTPNSTRLRKLYTNLCNNNLIKRICLFGYSLSSGSSVNQIENRIGVYLANFRTGASSWNSAHFIQLVEHGYPVHFDSGNEEINRQKYGSTKPPPYNVSRINSTYIAMIFAQYDSFNHIQDIRHLKGNLSVKVIEDYSVPDSSYDHLDLVWGKQVGTHVNRKVLDMLARYTTL